MQAWRDALTEQGVDVEAALKQDDHGRFLRDPSAMFARRPDGSAVERRATCPDCQAEYTQTLLGARFLNLAETDGALPAMIMCMGREYWWTPDRCPPCARTQNTYEAQRFGRTVPRAPVERAAQAQQAPVYDHRAAAAGDDDAGY